MKRQDFLMSRKDIAYDHRRCMRFIQYGLISQYADGTVCVDRPGRESQLQYPSFGIQIIRVASLPDDIVFFMPGNPDKKLTKKAVIDAIGSSGAVFDEAQRALYAYPRRGDLTYRLDTHLPQDHGWFVVHTTDRKYAKVMDEKIAFIAGQVRVRARINPAYFELHKNRALTSRIIDIMRDNALDGVVKLLEEDPDALAVLACLVPTEKREGGVFVSSYEEAGARSMRDALRRVPSVVPYIGARRV